MPVALRLPLPTAQSLFNQWQQSAWIAVWREPVNIERNIENDIDFATTVASYFADAGSFFFHILTVIWGS